MSFPNSIENESLLSSDCLSQQPPQAGEWLRRTLDAAGIGTWEWDILAGEITWSENLEAVHGIAPGSFDGTLEGFLNIVHAEDRPRVMEAITHALEARILYQVEFRVRLAAGSIRWILGQGKAFYDEAGRAVRMVGIGTDITERKKQSASEKFLAEASEILASSLDYHATLQSVAQLAVPRLADWCAIHLLDAAGELQRMAITHADPARQRYAEELGRRYPPKREAPAGPHAVIRTGKSEWIREIPEALLRAAAQDEEHYRVLREAGIKSSLCVPLVARGKCLGTITLIAAETTPPYEKDDLVLAEELARRAALAVENALLLRAEQQARAAAEAENAARTRAEKTLRVVTEDIPALLAYVDTEGYYRFVNRGYEEWFVMPRSEILGKRVSEMMDQTAYARIQPYVQRALAGERVSFENQITYFDGVLRHTRANYVPDVHEDGKVRGFVVLVNDITEIKRAERALRESEERFRLAADAVKGLIYDHNLLDGTVQWSRGLVDIVGCHAEEAEQKADWWVRRIHSEDLPAVQAGTGVFAEGSGYSAEYRVRHKDGHDVHVWDNGLIMRDDEGRAVRVVGCILDVTRQKEAEQELRAHQAQIEALNVRLRRSMAETHHRLKNSLQTISALAELSAPETEEVVSVDALKRITIHVRSLAAIHDLLTQSVADEENSDFLSMRAALEKLIIALQSVVGERPIQAVVEDAFLPIRQATALTVLVNEAILNAVKHGGNHIAITFAISGETARLEVCDDGPGFPADFNPDADGNMGIELILSVGRWDLGGEVAFRNRAEGGACVIATFPLPKS